nr:MAG TPA: hypothetical protein [Caudoviricetes sp.]
MGFSVSRAPFFCFLRIPMALYYKYVVCWSVYSLFCAFFMHKIFL